MRLEEESVPATRKPEPKYARYIPLVLQFQESGMKSARVVLEDGDEDPDVVPTRLKCAISNLRLLNHVGIATRSGDTYLTRSE